MPNHLQMLPSPFSVTRCLGTLLLCGATWPLTVQASASTPSSPDVAPSPEMVAETHRDSRHPSPLSENIFLKTKIKSLPVLEISSFDNHTREDISEGIARKLTDQKIQRLGLQHWAAQGHSVFLNYELLYPGNFKVFVFTLEGEMELITSMVTFDKNLNKIDELRVAYDEVAESWLRVKSKISRNKIEVRTIDESSGKTVVKTKIYKISESGHFLDMPLNKKK